MAIGAKMGISDFIKYQSLFNFGSKTGIDLPEEIAGIVYDQKGMNEVELATCTFGQGFTCTMIQQIASFCAVVKAAIIISRMSWRRCLMRTERSSRVPMVCS